MSLQMALHLVYEAKLHYLQMELMLMELVNRHILE
jgi:hypothetical protein